MKPISTGHQAYKEGAEGRLGVRAVIGHRACSYSARSLKGATEGRPSVTEGDEGRLGVRAVLGYTASKYSGQGL